MMQTVVAACAGKLGGLGPDARRLFHGRGHCYAGYEHVTVTWYPPYLHIALYKPEPNDTVGALVQDLRAILPDVQGVAVQQRDGRRTATRVWWGEVPDEHLVYENGLAFWIQPKRNQNAGLFLDMGHVRQALAPSMPGAKVLNLFAYTCAFSVAAVAQGAELVVNNDMNANVLAIGKRNHLANQQDLRKVRMYAHDVMKAWKKLQALAPYDVLIIDPPTNQRGSFVAEKDYPKLLKKIPALAAPGARIIACLNSPFLSQDFLTNQMARWVPDCRLVEAMPPHPDFTEAFPERGLKVLDYRYRG